MPEGSLRTTDYTWIKRWLDARGTPSLEQRLRELFEALDPDLRSLISQRIDPIPEVLASVLESPRDIWTVVGRLRNDLAHGGPQHSGEEVVAALLLVMTIATAITLQEISGPTTRLADAIKVDRWRPV